MKIILTILISAFFGQLLFAQSKSLLNMSNGDIYIFSDHCCLEFYEKFQVFNDIAFSNDKIYAVDTNLNIIDFNSKQVISSFPIYNTSGVQIFSDGLEIVNDSLLFLDDQTDLYYYNLNTNTLQFVGNTGYYCSGDLLFTNNKLFMTTDSNELIEIQLNSSYTINNITIVDYLTIGSVFGLSKTNDASDLLLFSGFSSYKLNSLNSYSKVCDLTSSVNGASYYREQGMYIDFPNVLTPNNDKVNDYIDLSGYVEFSIINRWGNEVFNNSYSTVWRGEDQKGNPVAEGVYFIIIHFKDCETIKSFCQNITILK